MRSTLSVADCLQLINTVDAVEVLEASSGSPNNLGAMHSLDLMIAGDRLNLATRTFARTVRDTMVKSSTEIAFEASFRICELSMRTRLTPMSPAL